MKNIIKYLKKIKQINLIFDMKVKYLFKNLLFYNLNYYIYNKFIDNFKD